MSKNWAQAANPATPREPANAGAALPLGLALLSLFFLPWGWGPDGLRWAWKIAGVHFAEAVPLFLGPAAGLVVLVAAWRQVAPRVRDMLWGAFGFLMLAAGLAEATTAFAADGLGAALLLGAALIAVGHILRGAGETPRMARALIGLGALLALGHLLWPVTAGDTSAPRVVALVKAWAGGQPVGPLTLEALLLPYLVVVGASAWVAASNPTSRRPDRWLGAIHRWGLPGLLLVAGAPWLATGTPLRALAFVSAAISVGVALQLAVRGARGAITRAAAGEFNYREPRPFFARFCLISLSAAMVFLSFPRYDLIHLTWLALLPALFVITEVRPRRAFLWGWWMGIVTNVGGFYWITGLLVEFAGLPGPVAFLLCVVLAAYNGLVFAFWAYLTRKLQGSSRLGLALTSALAFTAVEFLLWELFPWYLGNSQYLFLPVIQIAELTGVPGITFVIAFVASALHAVLRSKVRREPFPRRTAIAAVAVFGAVVVYGLIRIPMVDAQAAASPKLKVGVVQPDQRIKESWATTRLKLQKQYQLTRELAAKGAELIVLPESAYPGTYVKGLRDFTPLVGKIGVPMVFGAGSWKREDGKIRKYNSAYFVDHKGRLQAIYDKNYPLLFGEYLPFADHPWMQWVKKAFPYASFLTPGTKVEVFPFKGHRLGVLICYEDILPAFTRRVAAKDPHLLLNLTNDAWFGRSSEPYHHQALSIFRSVENRLYMVRSVRTGISGFIDATGRIYAQTKLEEIATLLEPVALMKGTTFYRAAGDVFAYLVLAALLFAIFEALLGWWRDRRGARR